MMKWKLGFCLFVLMVLPGCISSGTPELDESAWQPEIERFDVKQVLQLQENQEYDIFDYREDTVLILVSDRSKRNPLDINDQVNTTFYEKFVLFDFSLKEVTEEYPVQRFGICPSALLAFQGTVFSFFEVTSDKILCSSIYFIDNFGIQRICEGNFSPFGMGPVLQHYDNAVLFSFIDRENKTFGLTKISGSFDLEPILLFDSENVDYITDDFRASEGSYGYAVGEAGKITFYVGMSDGTETQISLPTGRKIHGFDLTKNELFVSLAGDGASSDSGTGIQIFDLRTGELLSEQMRKAMPIYSISANEYNQICGVRDFVLQYYTWGDRIEEITVNTSDISGGFFKILSYDKKFLVATYGYDKNPEFWIIS